MWVWVEVVMLVGMRDVCVVVMRRRVVRDSGRGGFDVMVVRQVF